MAYQIRILEQESDLEQCAPLFVRHFRWRCVQNPAAWGKLGYLPGRGLLLRMHCEEANPKRTMREPGSQVYLDSAMEAFFSFPKGDSADHQPYLNLEFNANGALLAQYGSSRTDRAPVAADLLAHVDLSVCLEPSFWQAELTVPECLLQRLFQVEPLRPGDRFRFNLYKISEDAAIEHYASAFPIESATPDFHLPSFFGEGVLTV